MFMPDEIKNQPEQEQVEENTENVSSEGTVQKVKPVRNLPPELEYKLQQLIALLKMQGRKYHVFPIQIIGIQGAGKTNLMSWIVENCFPDYVVRYVKTPSVYDMLRVFKMGINGKSKYIIDVDDPSFVLTKSSSKGNNFELMQNALANVRHTLAEKSNVNSGTIRVVIIWAHHYTKSIAPYLRETQINVLASIGNKQNIKHLTEFFDVHWLKRFKNEYLSYVFSDVSDLDKKIWAPILINMFGQHSILYIGKANIDITKYAIKTQNPFELAEKEYNDKQKMNEMTTLAILYQTGLVTVDQITSRGFTKDMLNAFSRWFWTWVRDEKNIDIYTKIKSQTGEGVEENAQELDLITNRESNLQQIRELILEQLGLKITEMDEFMNRFENELTKSYIEKLKGLITLNQFTVKLQECEIEFRKLQEGGYGNV